jgi:hypothetical protein
MAPPRRKQAYTPALLENLRFRFEETPESVVDIAASVPTSHTTLRHLARAQGWTKFKPPPLDLSPAARLAAEAGKLAAEAGKFAAEAGRQGAEADMSAPSFSLPPRSGGEGRLGVREHGEAGWGDASAIESGAREETPPPPTPDPSPPLAEPVIGPAQEGRTRWLAGGGETPDLSNLADDARKARLSEMARGLDVQLALLRQRQAYPQRGEDRRTINAEFNRLAATAAIIEHQLEKLEGGRGAAVPDTSHDDIPEDIDAFRLRLAAKIDAFFERRPDIGDGGADAD